jgi:hypothetical protein
MMNDDMCIVESEDIIVRYETNADLLSRSFS